MSDGVILILMIIAYYIITGFGIYKASRMSDKDFTQDQIGAAITLAFIPGANIAFLLIPNKWWKT